MHNLVNFVAFSRDILVGLFKMFFSLIWFDGIVWIFGLQKFWIGSPSVDPL